MEMIWKELAVQGELFLRLLAACILGCAIGFERKNRNKGAGMRTHTLVCLGAALMMIISKYGFQDTPGSDGSRMASQVVSGIGFLGAGIIYDRCPDRNAPCALSCAGALPLRTSDHMYAQLQDYAGIGRTSEKRENRSRVDAGKKGERERNQDRAGDYLSRRIR